MRTIGTNQLINKENYRRLLWLAENDPSWEDMNLADMVNIIIERYFTRNGLDALIEQDAASHEQEENERWGNA